MTDVGCQDGVAAKFGRAGYRGIGEPRCVTRSDGAIEQGAGQPRRSRVDGQDTATVEVQQDSQPLKQARGLPRRLLAPQLGDPGLDFGYGHGREEKILGIVVQPGDQGR